MNLHIKREYLLNSHMGHCKMNSFAFILSREIYGIK